MSYMLAIGYVANQIISGVSPSSTFNAPKQSQLNTPHMCSKLSNIGLLVINLLS
jgi:hypothetical protein